MTDPVLIRRARAARFAEVGQRVGYALFGVAVVGFFTGFALDFPSWLVTIIVASLLLGSLILAPAIVVGYGVKAAIRDDAEHGRS